MLNEIGEQSSEVTLENAEIIDFKTAKQVNNDLIDISRALQELPMRTEVGKEIKDRFMEVVIYELQKLEDSKVVF
ncbi:MAG: hypothetical protein AYK18_07945 [Theionarchaea archaeon DG-70]|nr:MAG: hypothetical protein AYK18_07945 [Theionarchaea archaeon DG-70]MBU7026952.1 hypothetical protein [Theionarchaea archaeon]